jgi:hypothetical protein
MSTPIITQAIQPPQASTLAGGTTLIYGSDFQSGASVFFGTVKSLNTQFINSGFLAADIPSTKIAGTYDITVLNLDGGTFTLSNAFTAFPPVIITNDYPYTLLVNGTDVTKLQKDRLSLNQEAGIVSSYSVAMNKLSFEIPIEKENLLFDAPDENHFVIKKGNDIIYQGYLDGKEVNECLKIIKIDSMPFLNLLSKDPVSYADTTTQSAVSLLVSRFASLVAGLPVQYAVNPFIINGSLLDNINIGVNTGTGNLNAIDIMQNLFDIFDVGVMLWNNTLYLFAIPETLQGVTTKDITGLIDKPLEDIKDLTGTFFNQYILKCTVPTGATGFTGTVTAGTGSLKKDLNSDNVFFADSTSAQNVVDRKNTLYSTMWKSASTNVRRETNFKLGDHVLFRGEYDNYAFIVSAIEDRYVGWGLKMYGKKIN